ncbi:SDR family oxidoreductase [Kitasatospora purpeofusca]|uniref:SDR family NAD(P)-dependent oxidoreductase n=1 Tax=Kitasatospora purpeofusca TaxID=67352 RepID=UPI002E0DAD2A|nr:SDR family oxidoreductase [Kitasatospora purpeofusca]
MVTSLAGQVAVVTGASRGIGAHLSLRLAEEGAKLVLVARSARSCATTAAACRGHGAETRVHPMDIADEVAVRCAVADVVSEFGQIDLLVNNAGIIDPSEVPLWETDPAAWLRVLQTNLYGPYLLDRYVVPHMISRRCGRVIHLNSNAAVVGRPAYSAYCAAKTALLKMSECLDAYASDHGVHSFDVSPGVVRTDMTASMPMHGDRERWTSPEKVGDMVLKIARGELDALSARFLRAEDDTERSLGQVVGGGDRRLRVMPYGPADALAREPDPGTRSR